MRDGWIETTLGQIAEIQMGQSPDGSTYNNEGVGLPFMQGSAEFGEHFPKPEKWCSEPKKIAEIGDLLLSVRAPVGDTNFADQRIAVGRGLSVIRAKSSLSDTKFIRLFIQLNINEMISNSGSGMFSSITGQNLRNFSFLLPPLNEQKRIVNLISSVDSYIDALEQQAESARKSRNAVLHEILSAGGDGWTETTLGGVLELLTDGSHFSPKTVVSGYPYITVRDLNEGRIDFENCAFVDIHSFEELSKNGCAPQEGDVLFSKDGTVGKVALVPEQKKFVVLSSLAILRPNLEIVSPQFLAIYLRSDDFQSRAIGNKTGLAIKRLVLKTLRTLLIMVPPLPEQKRIVDLISSMDEGISATKKLISETKQLRSGLLSRLLRGEHQIPESYDKVMGAA